MIALANRLKPRYVIPIHHDIPPWEADPADLEGRVGAEVIVPTEWVDLP